MSNISIREDVELHNEGEEIFFDSVDSLETCFDNQPSTSYMVEKPDSGFWTKELSSTVHERRSKFMRETGFDKLISTPLDTNEEQVRSDLPKEQLELERMLDTSSSPVDDGDADSTCTEVQDTENKPWQQVESEFGSHSTQPFSGGVGKTIGVNECRARRRWWRRLISKRNDDALSRNSELPKPVVKKQMHNNSIEITKFSMVQETIAHNGSIRTMKFSPCGMYLATGGEDCVVRIWKVKEIEAPCNPLTADSGSSTLFDGSEMCKLRRKGFNCSAIVNPDEDLRLDETPLQEYFGHTSDILELSWSTSDYLLSASKDKSVRMWRIGFNNCVKVFHHNDYVTCIQINPVDDRYFISGSLDGKARIWAVDENRVVDWIDTKDIITTISYQTDAKGFVVGTLSGNCRFYVYSGNNLELDRELNAWGKKKMSGKQITGLQFCPGDSRKIMITSLDSKVRIFDDELDLVHKFGGSWKSKSPVVASFTDDGKRIVSVGENCNICVRDNSAIASPMKSVYPCENFFFADLSEGVTVAVPRPSKARTVAVPVEQSSESSIKYRNHQCSFSLGSCFQGNSATWPEEKLAAATPIMSEPEPLMATCSLIIATASCNGVIRLFNYCKLPVKLC